jgi:hypothetical protein
MEIVEVNPEEFDRAVKFPYHVYGSGSFNDLNNNNAESVHYLLFNDTKYRLGLICGVREETLFSPFSAPFGGFIYLAEDLRIQIIDEAIQLLIEWARRKLLKQIHFTLPPSIYNESYIAKQTNSLYRKNFRVSGIDLNYSFILDRLDDNYDKHIWSNARKNLKISLSKDLNFIRCKSLEEKEKAFRTIKKNREIRGYPLKMTWNQILETIKIINSDFFLITDYRENILAAAIVFEVNTEINQVIYWGDLPEYSANKTMNFLSYKIFEYYIKTGKRVIDIGPSTENSVPNFGLCDFKESIGCKISQKMSFVISV